MRQRNDTASALYAPSEDPPFEVAPGEEIDYPIYIVGLTQADESDEESDDTDGEEPAE